VIYKIIIKKVAMANPRVPPFSRPRFHPKYMPEMTYPTPNPQSIRGVKVLLNFASSSDGTGFFMLIGYDTKLSNSYDKRN
jgi:hypothetical protein